VAAGSAAVISASSSARSTISESSIMWLLHRDDYKHERDGSKSVLNGECEIIVAKQRNGATGSAVVGFDRQHTRFYDLAEDDERLLP
jgi:replicative DNA helicase